MLLFLGVHPKLVQGLMDHADACITLNTYSNFMPSMGGKTASAMEDLLQDPEE